MAPLDASPLLTTAFIATGGLCGSEMIDLEFETYLQTTLGDDKFQAISIPRRQKMMREFESTIKRNFRGDDQDFSLDVFDVEDDEKAGIKEGEMLLTGFVSSSEHFE